MVITRETMGEGGGLTIGQVYEQLKKQYNVNWEVKLLYHIIILSWMLPNTFES